MTRRRGSLLQAVSRSLFLTGFLVSIAPGMGADWPQWRGPDRNGVAPDSPPLVDSWPSGWPRIVWQDLDLAAGGYSSPVVANGRVYVYIHQNQKQKDTVICLDERLGVRRWQMDFPVARVEGDEASGTPCIFDGFCLVQGAVAVTV